MIAATVPRFAETVNPAATSHRHAVPIRFFYRAGFLFGAETALRMMEKRHYRVNRSDICYIKYLMESYEGIATVSTENAADGRIVIVIAPGCESTVDAVMESLKKETYFERLDEAATAQPVPPAMAGC
jgi:hypothetical protein